MNTTPDESTLAQGRAQQGTPPPTKPETETPHGGTPVVEAHAPDGLSENSARLKVGLLVPCYVDQFYPAVAIATLELLEKCGFDVVVPKGQTCCGQPMANTGFERDAIAGMHYQAGLFAECDVVVCPSGSCTHFVRHHYHVAGEDAAIVHMRRQTFELCEFLVRHAPAQSLSTRFPFKTGLHQSCHGQRGLRLSSSSERVEPEYSHIRTLLQHVEGIELMTLQRTDECCGFGGTFSVFEEAVSVRMGKDRLRDHLQSGVEVITGGDVSCLMHLEGIVRRENLPLKVMHIAEILNYSPREQEVQT